MSDSVSSARAILDGWREQQAHRVDPIRFHFMEAMERRAASLDGEVRRVLDDRLTKLLEDYAGDIERAASGVDSSTAAQAAASETLGGLIDHIAACSGTAPAFPELPALGEFRSIWSRIHSESQLRRALDHLPANAGPLNSSALVHRSITLMRELSPGYLQQFLSYVETLSWVEQMNDFGALVAKDAPRTTSGRKRARGKTRE
jgi:hypothetical protein